MKFKPAQTHFLTDVFVAVAVVVAEAPYFNRVTSYVTSDTCKCILYKN